MAVNRLAKSAADWVWSWGCYWIQDNSPHLCVGFLFLVLHLRFSASPPLRRSNLSTHTHTQLSTQNLLVHTHNLSTHTHTLSTHTLSTCKLSHNLSTHNLLTHTTFSYTTYSHTHNLTTVTLRGRRGPRWHPPSLCVAGVALGEIDRHFASQAWHLWHWAGTGGALGSQWRRGRRGFLRGKRGTRRHGRASCVAGVGLGDVDRHCAWQALHFWHWAGSGGALGSQMTPWTPRLFCVAGVALGDIHLYFAWQAWHLVTSTVTLRGRRSTDGAGLALVARLVPRWRCGRRGFLRGRRGTRRHGRASCVAGVALGDIDRHFAWQAWHFWHWAGSGGALGSQMTHNFTTHTTSSHTQLTHTRVPCCTRQSFTISFLFPAFPCISHAIFTFLLLLAGRSWHVGLSGPLIVF